MIGKEESQVFLRTARRPLISKFVFVIIVIVIGLDNIQFHGVEAYDFQICSAFFARHYVALVRVRIDVDISITFGTGSGRHFLYLQLSNFGGRVHPRFCGETLPFL